jgi:hypothetical protein
LGDGVQIEDRRKDALRDGKVYPPNEPVEKGRFWLFSDSRYFISLIANLRKMTFPTDSTLRVTSRAKKLTCKATKLLAVWLTLLLCFFVLLIHFDKFTAVLQTAQFKILMIEFFNDFRRKPN